MQFENLKILTEEDNLCGVCEEELTDKPIEISLLVTQGGMELTLETIPVCEECFEKCEFSIMAVEVD